MNNLQMVRNIHHAAEVDWSLNCLVLVCGGRDYQNEQLVHQSLSRLIAPGLTSVYLMHGGCPTGADLFANNWASENNYRRLRVCAEWNRYGKAAGPYRNTEMQILLNRSFVETQARPLVIAFDGGRGTYDMVSKARETNAILWFPDVNPDVPVEWWDGV